MRDDIIQSKPYDQVTWAMAHDSHTVHEVTYYNDKLASNVDQYVPVRDQLNAGIRAVRISAENRSGHPITLRHGSEVWDSFVPVWFWTLERYLTDVRTFLDANPSAVVTIIDEGDCSDADFSAVFAQVLGGTSKVPGGGADGRGVKVFTPSAGAPFAWPTVGAMVAANTRLVVFRKNKERGNGRREAGQGKFPYILRAWGSDDTADDYMFANPYEYFKPKDVRFFPDDSSGAGKGTFAADKLYLFNHYYYDHVSGSELLAGIGKEILQSSQAYIPWGVGSWLITSAVRAWVITGKRPNFLNVDFFGGANLRPGETCTAEERGYLMPLVDKLNSVDSHDELRFVIRCAKKPSLALSSRHPTGINRGISVVTYDATDTSQRWSFRATHVPIAVGNPPDKMDIALAQGDQVLYVPDSKSDKAVLLHDHRDDREEVWSIDLADNNKEGFFSIKLVWSDNVCLDADAADGDAKNLVNGAKVQSWNWHGNGNQQWKLELV